MNTMRLWLLLIVQSANGKAATVYRLGFDLIMIAARFHHHIIGFCCTNTKFIDCNRLHWLTIGADYGHFQVRNSHIKKRHRRGINKA